MSTPNISHYKGYDITVTDWGATFVYADSPIRTSSLASAMQVIDCLVAWDERHGVVTVV
jgi:hypothetical protein